MKKQIIHILTFALLLVSVSAAAMNPAALRVLRRIPKKRADIGVKKPKDRPYPIRPYPGSSFRPEPPAPITPIEPIGVPTISPPEAQAKAKKEEEQRFQQISITPLPELKETGEEVLVLDTSLTATEQLNKQMLEQYKNNIIEVLDKSVMALVDENVRLKLDWAKIDDMRNLFAYFNYQVDALKAYIDHLEHKQCIANDNYCDELIEQIKQLQKQLKRYMETLSTQLSL